MCAMIPMGYQGEEWEDGKGYICERCGCELDSECHYDDLMGGEPENPVYFDENHAALCQECLLYLHRRDAD